MAAQSTVVALFDVLGFEERLRSDGLASLVVAYKELSKIVDQRRDCLIIDATVGAKQLDDGTIQSHSAIGVLVVEQAFFSDTIIFWSIFDRARFWTFCDLCSQFVCEVLNLRIPIRGGIAVGEAHMDKSTNTYLGYPVVESARVEAAQQWIGVSFGPSFAESPYKNCLRPEIAMFYTGHRKPGVSHYIPGLVLDWPRKWRSTYNASPCQHLSQMNTKPKFSSYYENAIRFAELSEKRAAEDG